MIVIVSPAKNMKTIQAGDMTLSLPAYIDKTDILLKHLKKMHVNELQTSMKLNEKLALLNQERYQQIALDHYGSPAIFTYDGMQYRSMNVNTYSQKDQEYMTKHIRILSGLYGVLRPLDSIYPYRLEMQTRLQIDTHKNLYEYWGDMLYQELTKETKVIVNLASSEYSKSIYKYVKDPVSYVTCTFKINKKGILKVESTQAKKARGLMVLYMVKEEVKTLEELKYFHMDGYLFREELSDDQEYVFVKE